MPKWGRVWLIGKNILFRARSPWGDWNSCENNGLPLDLSRLLPEGRKKSVQLVRLKKWAQEQGYWYDDRSLFGDFFDRGSENEVYLSPDQKYIIKLNDFRYSDDNLTSFFERIKAHNRYFDACPYRMIGFGENSDGKVCAVLVQRFVHSVRIATKEEVHDEFIRIGFHPEDNGEYYTNGQHDIFDAVEGNVLMGDDGHIYFIDTIIYPSDTGGYETYRSLSPRCSKK